MDRGSDRLTIVSISVAAVITILFELTSTRILSFIFWNHLVYLTITIALLGFGISGTLLAMSSGGRLIEDRWLPSKLWFGLGFSLLFALWAFSRTIETLATSPSWVKLAISYLVCIVPFVFSGCLISLILAHAAKFRVGKLYAADLAASGAACVGFYVLLTNLGASAVVVGLAAVAFLMAVLWLPQSARRSLRGFGWASVAATLVLAMAAAGNPRFLDFMPEGYKELGRALRASEHTRIEATTWTPIARIDVVGRSDGERVLPYYTQHPPGSFKIIMQDASAHTRLLSREAIADMQEKVDASTETSLSTLPYAIKDAPRVGVVGVGGGIDVAAALAYGAQSVTGLELNPATAGYATETYSEYTGGLLSDPRVKFVNSEARSFLRRNDEQFDLLQVIAIDTFAALSSGAYVLSENYLYTVEAFHDFYDRLAPGGVLSFARFLFNPPRETLRLTTVAASVWREQPGERLERSFMVFGDRWGLAMFKKGGFTIDEVAALRSEADRRGIAVLYFPKLLPNAEQQAFEAAYYRDRDSIVRDSAESFNEMILSFADGTEARTLAAYVHNVTPTTDNSPFFFEYHRLGAFGFPSLDKLRGNGVSTTLLIILAEAAVLSIFAILGPLAAYRRSGLGVPDAKAFTAYFAAIGFAFMLVEIALIQKSVLFLGDPMHALTVILATILVGAGFGSFLHGRLAMRTDLLVMRGGAALIGMIVVMAFALTPIFQALIAIPFAARVAVIVVLLLVPSVLMGLFMPAGLQALRNERSDFVPWAWGINGCTSVFGSVAAILIALVHGFSMVLWVGACCYAVATGLALLVLRESRDIEVGETPPALAVN
jgi:spermidine synthase